MPTPSSRWSVANTVSIVRRVASASGPSARHVATRQLRDGIRPANETERLDERGDRPDDDRQHGQGRPGAERDREQGRQRQHRQGAHHEGMPAQDQPGATGVEPTQDRVGRLAQDVRVVERTAELDEREVEPDRHDDQQHAGDELDGHIALRSASAGVWHGRPSRRHPPGPGATGDAAGPFRLAFVG